MIRDYTRISKAEAQDTRMQEAALRAAGVEKVFYVLFASPGDD